MDTMLTELRQQGYQVYHESISYVDATQCAIVRKGKNKYLAVKGSRSPLFDGVHDGSILICNLSQRNAQTLHKLFPYTKPCRLPTDGFSIGLGDRLGFATPAHARAIKLTTSFPVFAQQSTRELNLTDRTFGDVITAATFGVFEAGYKSGYAADGDHLKSITEIEYALSSGCTLITLDCSEYIYEEYLNCENEIIDEKYQILPYNLREYFEKQYLHHPMPIVDKYDEFELRRFVLTFIDAINHVEACWKYINGHPNCEVDVELSIDETKMSTSPHAHFFISNELTHRGIRLWSCAPRFHGRFEKAVDYIGSLVEFERDFNTHQKIASHFGYKLSIHSGSDKHSLYPIISRVSSGNVHLKTSGTSWLETLRLVSCTNPVLFRSLYCYALQSFPAAKNLYEITTEIDDIPMLTNLNDDDLQLCLDYNSSRQLLHITYGNLLSEKSFHAGIIETIHRYEHEYYEHIRKHIRKHLTQFFTTR